MLNIEYITYNIHTCMFRVHEWIISYFGISDGFTYHCCMRTAHRNIYDDWLDDDLDTVRAVRPAGTGWQISQRYCAYSVRRWVMRCDGGIAVLSLVSMAHSSESGEHSRSSCWRYLVSFSRSNWVPPCPTIHRLKPLLVLLCAQLRISFHCGLLQPLSELRCTPRFLERKLSIR